ncbi:hypothetical protein SAZ_38115 [Streptomyces noursei ZPM]|nr:hypothetical protein SAZ_38115 [Streptomyces noursei ZPM]
MARCARTAWVLADGSKLAGGGGFPYWAAVPPGTGLISGAAEPGCGARDADDGGAARHLAAFAAAGWSVLPCDRPPAPEDGPGPTPGS